jgi:hypothetical protein
MGGFRACIDFYLSVLKNCTFRSSISTLVGFELPENHISDHFLDLTGGGSNCTGKSGHIVSGQFGSNRNSAPPPGQRKSHNLEHGILLLGFSDPLQGQQSTPFANLL